MTKNQSRYLGFIIRLFLRSDRMSKYRVHLRYKDRVLEFRILRAITYEKYKEFVLKPVCKPSFTDVCNTLRSYGFHVRLGDSESGRRDIYYGENLRAGWVYPV